MKQNVGRTDRAPRPVGGPALAALAAVLAFAVGCEPEEAEVEERTVEAEELRAVEPAAPRADTVEVPAPDPSGVSARAVVRHEADSVHVDLELSGLEPGATYVANIHEGTCDETGAPVRGTDATADTDGRTTARITIPAAELAPERSHIVELHGPGGERPACGPLPLI